jgi:hypothetical protein
VTLPIAGSVRGVAAEGALLFAATATSVQAHRGGSVAWTTPLVGAGPIAAGGKLLAVTMSLSGASSDKLAVRGDPAAGVTALDLASGAKKWTVLFDSTEWSSATAGAMLGAAVGGAGA